MQKSNKKRKTNTVEILIWPYQKPSTRRQIQEKTEGHAGRPDRLEETVLHKKCSRY